jgi:hypothetical protein
VAPGSRNRRADMGLPARDLPPTEIALTSRVAVVRGRFVERVSTRELDKHFTFGHITDLNLPHLNGWFP